MKTIRVVLWWAIVVITATALSSAVTIASGQESKSLKGTSWQSRYDEHRVFVEPVTPDGDKLMFKECSQLSRRD